MLYWHSIVGKYFVYTYGYTPEVSEKFIYWNKPKVGCVLFGVINGWLIYSPFFFLFIVGLIWLLIKRFDSAFGILLCFMFIVYANASWWSYTFSCSFGYRAFIEYYPLFSIPIAFLFSKIFNKKHKVFVKGLIVFLLFLFSFTNLRLQVLSFRSHI